MRGEVKAVVGKSEERRGDDAVYFGRAEDWANHYDRRDGSQEPFNENVTTPCTVKTLDTPGILVDRGAAFNMNHRFVGEIHDVCHGNIVIATKSFGILMSGTAPATDDQNADGSPSSPPDVSPSVVGYDGVSPTTATSKISRSGEREER